MMTTRVHVSMAEVDAYVDLELIMKLRMQQIGLGHQLRPVCVPFHVMPGGYLDCGVNSRYHL